MNSLLSIIFWLFFSSAMMGWCAYNLAKSTKKWRVGWALLLALNAGAVALDVLALLHVNNIIQ